jgi:hypothetical protein
MKSYSTQTEECRLFKEYKGWLKLNTTTCIQMEFNPKNQILMVRTNHCNTEDQFLKLDDFRKKCYESLNDKIESQHL